MIKRFITKSNIKVPPEMKGGGCCACIVPQETKIGKGSNIYTIILIFAYISLYLMDDLYYFFFGISIIAFLFMTMFRLTSNPKAKQKDMHYSTLIKIKDDTIDDLQKRTRSLRSKIQRLEDGPTFQEEGKEEGNIDDLIDLYDNAPRWVKAIASKDDIVKFYGENKNKIPSILEKFKGKQKDNKEGDLTTSGL